MTVNKTRCAVLAIMLLLATAGTSFSSINLPASPIDLQWRMAQRQLNSSYLEPPILWASADTSLKADTDPQHTVIHPKSPGKAFVLSMLVPGLGQYYNGNKVKAATFLGIEATAWLLQFSWRADGKTRTREFETFQRVHWSEEQYSVYLDTVYGFTDDDSITATEISHHLPDTRTQQYYEMTGKYNQFAWGWDDAMLNSQDLQTLMMLGHVPKAIGDSVPVSLNRNKYETMRHDANAKFSNARKMIMLALGNRLVSAFEAFVSAKKAQRKASGGVGGTKEFSHWKVQAKLKSIYAKHDTPYLKVTYGF